MRGGIGARLYSHGKGGVHHSVDLLSGLLGPGLLLVPDDGLDVLQLQPGQRLVGADTDLSVGADDLNVPRLTLGPGYQLNFADTGLLPPEYGWLDGAGTWAGHRGTHHKLLSARGRSR